MIRIDIETAKALLARLEACDPKGDRGLDRDLFHDMLGERRPRPGFQVNMGAIPRYTASMDAAAELIGHVLPGWAWSCGTCVVTNDGWVKPDVEGPDVHLCDLFDEGFFGDAKGGSVPLSMLVAMMHGVIAKLTVEAGLPFESHIERRRKDAAIIGTIRTGGHQ